MRHLRVGAFLGIIVLIVGIVLAVQVRSAPAAEPHVILPGSNPAWLASPPSFAGRVIHGTVISVMQMTDARDPSSEQVVNGEFWVELNADGSVRRSRERFVLRDGGVLQEDVYSDGQLTTVYGTGDGHVTAGCVETAEAPPPLVVPPFAADATILTALGFVPSDGLSQTLPQTLPLPSSAPLRTYGTDESAVQGWQQQTPLEQGDVEMRHLEVDASGRIVVGDAWQVNAHGVVSNELRQMYGPLEVYDVATVPGTLFELEQQAIGACHA